MDKEEIKKYLLDNPSEIEKVLENLGCDNIKLIRNRYFVCSRPDGDNKGAINVKLNKSLGVQVWTKKNEFEKKHKSKDIYSLVQFIKNVDFDESIKIIANICGIKYNNTYKERERSSSMDFLRSFKSKKRKEIDTYIETKIEYKTEERFVRGECKLFSDDGISDDTQDIFEVSYDVLDNRVVFPIKNDYGDIVSFKGRTMEIDYKIYGIPKYMYYIPIQGVKYLFGYYENYYNILDADDCIVVESEKGVMQCHSFEVRNVLSPSKKTLSEEQVRKILQLGKPVTIAFDKDVTIEEIYNECCKFKNLCEVYYIWDEDNILKEKESPCDKGFDIWNELYTKYRFKFTGGV